MRVWLQTRLFVVSLWIYFGLIDLFELTSCGVRDDQRPGFVRLAESDGIGVPRSAVTPEGLVRAFRNMRPAHNYLKSRLAQSVGNQVCAGDHSGHRADTDKAY